MGNEITVKISCSLQEMYNILESKGFSIIDKYNLEDIYYINKDIDIKKQSIREILKKYILIRKVTQFIPDDFIKSYTVLELTLKSKNIASDGIIISQDKIDCQIQDIKQGKEFIEALGYKNLMTIKERAIVYGKGKLKLAIKDIENSEKLIEIETIDNDPDFDTTEKLKEKLNDLQIPINTNDYFVKKAEIELKKFYRSVI